MNRQKTKALEFQAQLILIDWIRTLVPEDQKEEVTLSNVMELAPAFSYYSRDNSCLLYTSPSPRDRG